LPSVYEVPLILHKQNFDEKILNKLHLPIRKPDLKPLINLVQSIKTEKKKVLEVAIVGKYFGTGNYQLRDSYAALFDAIDHASWKNGVIVKTKWIDAENIEVNKRNIDEIIGNPDGIIVPIGWGIRGSEGMIQAANYARVKKIPYLGLCYGMQLAVVAFARYVLGWRDANTTENNEKTAHPVIHLIPDQEKNLKNRAYGGTMRLGAWDAIIQKNTLAFSIYDKYNGFIDKKSGLTSERHRHRWEFNNKYIDMFEKQGLIVSARSILEHLVEIIELPQSQHPFYIGTQGHPEYKSNPLHPHPIFLAFIAAMTKKHSIVKQTV
jgi:CTP synthase